MGVGSQERPAAARCGRRRTHRPWWSRRWRRGSWPTEEHAEWSATLRELDATWEQDWPQAITVLEVFLDRWPGYPAAEDKLYAALVADAEDNIQAEQVATAAAELERAARLLPERGEAWARLAQLATAAASAHP